MISHETSEHRPLLSTATILILSGFLIGISIGNAVGSELSPYLFACGVAGLLSFVVFELANRRRAAQAAEKGQRQIENRLQKHVRPINGPELKPVPEFRLVSGPENENPAASGTSRAFVSG